MLYDPKHYYPGGWKGFGKERRKTVYSWESVTESEAAKCELTAIKCEDNGFFVIDLDDVTDAAAAFIAESGLNNTGTRKVKTQSGGFHWYFEMPEGIDLFRWCKKSSPVQGIDFLGSGMVFCPPSAEYSLAEGDDICEAPAYLIEYITAELLARTRSDKPNDSGPANDLDVQQAIPALAAIPPDCDYDTWVRVGMSLRSLGSTGYEMWDTWSAQSDDYPGAKETAYKWHSFGDEGDIGLGTLFHLAESFGYRPVNVEDLIKKTGFKARTMDELNDLLTKLPPCEQVCGPFQTGTWGIIYAPPGAGKSRFIQALAWHIGKGKDFFAWKTPKPRSVFILDAEMSVQAMCERGAQWFPWGDNVVFDMLQDRELFSVPMFELGSPDHTNYIKTAAADADVVVIDNIESTLVPHKDGIWSPETWQQTKPLRDWATSHNKLLIFVDHTNAAGEVQGTKSKTRASWVNIKLERLSEPGDDECKLKFKTSLSKPARNDMPLSQIRPYQWKVDNANRWSQKPALTTKEQVRAYSDAGMNTKEIAEKMGLTPRRINQLLNQ